MAVEESILRGTKKILGLAENYDAFDHDVITHINSAFFVLYQLGVGPSKGFAIESEDETWDEFTGGKIPLNPVQTYIYLKVRLVFDPPGTPHHIQAMKEQIAELEGRLKMERELSQWTAPSSSPSLP